MALPDEMDDDTVLSALLPIDRTVVSAGNTAVEQTIVSGPGGELDEKTHAVERRELNTDPRVSGSARAAFTPHDKRERYGVRKDASSLPPVARISVSAPPARTPPRQRRKRSGAAVVAAVVAITVVVALAVVVILVLVLDT